MNLKFWGTRSSVASPGRNTMELGGNTPCLVMQKEKSPPLIFNSGTGIIEYATRGINLKEDKEFHLFFSNFSWDLIQGFPFFIPIHIPGTDIHLYSPRPVSLMKDNFTRLFDGSYSPLRDLSYLNANIHFHFIEETIQVGEFEIETKVVHHPYRSYAYKITGGGKKTGIIYHHENTGDMINDHLVEFMTGVDILIHDAKYSESDYLVNQNHGHSSMEKAIQNGIAMKAKYLFLTSYHFHYTDDYIRLYLDRYLKKNPSPAGMKIILSSEKKLFRFA